ncbi:cytochrome P450 [Mycobacterium sp. SM1]|uniref:cytochrome P450 n=1 Tax=Mycobacterium sp. SM1 TaxID=2816243 RepID=UPI001BD04585|nr:cytochrome P450 [Mycobacterium sp. SM1]MBS4729215.1 cytochrome P450 [Mycobacterium sp. SM1]
MHSPPLHHKESPVFAADRGAYWRQLRELGPVAKISVGKPMLRGYYLTGRDDVFAALHDPDTFASPPKTFKLTSFGVPLPQVPLSCGTRAEHARFARVLHPLFSPRGLAPYARALRVRAETLIDTVAAKGRCEAVNVADTYACQALLTVCGMPADDATATRVIRAAVIGDSTGAAELELFKFLNSTLGAEMGNPRRPPGILWPLLDGLDDNNFPLSRVEVISVILLVFSVAGVEMVAAEICFMLLHLARDPQLQARLRADPAQIPAFIEEMLRLQSPGPAIPRITTREVDIGGVTIPAHSVVWLGLEAAGRENGGDAISTTGSGELRGQRHWAFGGGMHRCLGMHLARLEMGAFMTEWLSRIPQFDLEPGSSPTTVHQPTGVTHLDSLMLRWEAR